MTKKGELAKPLPPHGTRERYLHRLYPCRDNCPNEFTCRMANNEWHREYRRRNPYYDKRIYRGYSRKEVEERVVFLEQKCYSLAKKIEGLYRQILVFKTWLEENPPK